MLADDHGSRRDLCRRTRTLNLTCHYSIFGKGCARPCPRGHTRRIVDLMGSNFESRLFFLSCLCRRPDPPTASQSRERHAPQAVDHESEYACTFAALLRVAEEHRLCRSDRICGEDGACLRGNKSSIDRSCGSPRISSVFHKLAAADSYRT